jgi:hypothetical protein
MACHRIRFALRGNSGEPSRRYAALVWLSVAVGGLPNRPWSGGDVAGVLQVSPDWLNEAVGMTAPLPALPGCCSSPVMTGIQRSNQWWF